MSATSTHERDAGTEPDDPRDERLEQFVEQPPAGPNVQYLRDAERKAARRQLGEQGRVLDVACEANVTRDIVASSVTRVDFSTGASERAREALDDDVGDYEVTKPEEPRLPFPDDHFDAAVSIGPYDWKFLDVEALTAELHRVTRPDGRVVFSVPTPRSPYAANAKNRFYTPEEALELVSPDWRLLDYDLLFQYPRRLHSFVGRLPFGVQEQFVDVAEKLSDRLTARDRWDDASYLVLAVRPMKYAPSLERGLEALFRPVEENGFWDEERGCITRALTYEFDGGTLRWDHDDSQEWRYAPMALMGVLRWRVSPVADGRYDGKIQRELAYFDERVRDEATLAEIPSYGIGPLITAFALAGQAFDDRSYVETARSLFEHSLARFNFDHAEDSLLLHGWAHLYEQDPDGRLREAIDGAMYRISDRQTPEGLFEFDNGSTRRHQNTMYTAWALGRAIEATDNTGYLGDVERALDYTIENRMRDDGAFIWEDVSPAGRMLGELRKRIRGGKPYWYYLYECHQTFFVNAVAHYYRAGGDRKYDDAVRRAMAWIYGDNALGVDLAEFSGIGVPMRQMTVENRLDASQFISGWRDQRYKGTYEVGSYVMALTALVDGTFD